MWQVKLVRHLRVTLETEVNDESTERSLLDGRGYRSRLHTKFAWLLSCSSARVFSMLLSRYGYTLLVALTSAMLTFPFGFFRSSPEEVGYPPPPTLPDRPLVATFANLCPLVATFANLSPLVATFANLCPLVATCGHLWPPLATFDHL